MKITTTKTEDRGFVISRFSDQYGKACTLQKSSVAEPSCVWLGLNEADPHVLASDAHAVGLTVPADARGWVPYPIPPEVLLSTRMHLTQDMVRSLLPYLTHFADFGELPDPDTFDKA